MTIDFFVAGVAQPKGSARAFVPKGWTRPVITSANPRLKEWQTLVSLEAARHVSEGALDGPVVVELTFVLHRPATLPKKVQHCTKKPDVDKLARSGLDALTGIVFKDDAQVVDLVAKKRYVAPGNVTGVHVRVWPAPFEPAQPAQDISRGTPYVSTLFGAPGEPS
jgi:Holliday junction resolvase RusA-like endonuclease